MSEETPASKKPIRRPRGKARRVEGKCIACGRCQAVCPFEAIWLNEVGEPVIDLEKCTGCGKCLTACPAQALEKLYTPEEQALLEKLGKKEKPEGEGEQAAGLKVDRRRQGVWVFVEQIDGCAADVSWELLGQAQKLAQDLETEVGAFILGHDIRHLADEAFSYGAQKVYLIDDPILQIYRTGPYLRGTVNLIRRYRPEVVLMGATSLGRDLAGAAATSLETGLTADCTGLTVDKEQRLLEQTRPAFGGNIMATIITRVHRPQMASVRPHVLPKPAPVAGRQGTLVEENLNLKEEDICVKILEVLQEGQEGKTDIASADFLVSGGRGMQGPENFKILQELAALLGGTVSSSRAAVDAGWMPYERQVGQTGKTVRPKIYFACGISGAIQHLVGMQDSDLIIAINRDKDAPIFQVADLGIVGDVFQVVPAVIEMIRDLKAKTCPPRTAYPTI